MSEKKRREKEREKDKKRASLHSPKREEVMREDIPSQQMGDLHLKEEGWNKRAARRFRERVKRYSKKARRREDAEISRRWHT